VIELNASGPVLWVYHDCRGARPPTSHTTESSRCAAAVRRRAPVLGTSVTVNSVSLSLSESLVSAGLSLPVLRLVSRSRISVRPAARLSCLSVPLSVSGGSRGRCLQVSSSSPAPAGISESVTRVCRCHSLCLTSGRRLSGCLSGSVPPSLPQALPESPSESPAPGPASHRGTGTASEG
jgi:hypothetical protein